MSDRPSLAVTLRAEPSYRLGEPIVLRVEIASNADVTLQLLAWGTPLEEEFTADSLAVERDGEPLPYDGKLVKRTDPVAESYVLIGPRQRLETTVDVSAAYPIDRPGEYTVKVDSFFRDAFVVPAGEMAAPRPRAEHEPLGLQGPEVSFEVLTGAQPSPTVGARLREGQAGLHRESPALGPEPTVTGGTPDQKRETISAHHNAKACSYEAEEALNCHVEGAGTPYLDWFGSYDSKRYQRVTVGFTEIFDGLEQKQVFYEVETRGCAPDVFAYTVAGSFIVWLCALFFEVDEIKGPDSRYGILIHEWSHAWCSTKDYAYSESSCKVLAKNNPAKAIENADNYEYFAEHLN